MRALFVTQFVPLPADYGAKQRALAIVERLARHADTTLVAYDDGGADVAGLAARGVAVRTVPAPHGRVRRLAGGLRTASAYAGRAWSRELRSAVRECADPDLDLLVVESVQMAPLVRGTPARRRILDMQNVESRLAAAQGATRGAVRRPAYRIESAALRRWERRVLRDFDAVCVVSERDRSRLPAPARRVLVCPNGWDVTEAPPATDDPVAAFVALLSWAPNVDAARWLAGSVWPRVRAAVPAARLLLVGRDPAPAVRALAGDGVEVTGTVPDVRPWLARALVGLAPLRAGGGSRLKILESLGARRPVVATPVGAEGLEDLVGHGVVVAGDATRFAGEVVALLREPARAHALGDEGRRRVQARHGWDASLAPLLNWVEAGA